MIRLPLPFIRRHAARRGSVFADAAIAAGVLDGEVLRIDATAWKQLKERFPMAQPIRGTSPEIERQRARQGGCCGSPSHA